MIFIIPILYQLFSFLLASASQVILANLKLKENQNNSINKSYKG